MIATILAFGFIIFIHELAHFLVAKAAHLSVPEFSIGFGKVLYQRQFRGTTYYLRLFLLGGYVRPDDSFQQWPPATRIKVALAGPLANLFFAFAVFSLISFVGLPELTTKIGQVLPGRPAEKADLAPGDRLVAVNGQKVIKLKEMNAKVQEGNNRQVRLTVERGQRTFDVVVVPEVNTGKGALGIKAAGETVSTSFGKDSVPEGMRLTMENVKQSYLLFIRFVTFQKVDVAGPAGIVKLGAEQASFGLMNLLYFVAILSANLVTFNLVPIPALDGGIILIALVELVTGWKASAKLQKMATKASMSLVIALMMFVLLNDIIKILVR